MIWSPLLWLIVAPLAAVVWVLAAYGAACLLGRLMGW
jgi:hypothetical protein